MKYELNANQGAPSKMNKAVNALGRVLQTASIYGMKHPRTLQDVSSAHKELAAALSHQERLRLDIVQGRLFINGHPAEKPSPMVRVIATRLTSLKISGFSIGRDLDSEGLRRLFGLLSSGKSGTFEKDLAASNIPGVHTEKMEYRAVRAKETTSAGKDAPPSGTQGPAEPGVSFGADGRLKSETRSGTHVLDLDGGETPSRPADSSSRMDGSSPDSSQTANREIIAFLRGESGTDAAGSELTRLMSEPEKLANLILESAAVRQSSHGRDQGESMADLILGCLRRTYEGIKTTFTEVDSDQAHSMRKSLLLLEKNILNRFQDMMRSADPQTEAAIHEAMREMDESIELDIAAAQYVEHRAALERSERRIVEYLKARGPDEVKEHMQEAGLPLQEWKRLWVRNAPQSPPSSGQGGGENGRTPPGLGTLALILERFDSLMRQDKPDPATVQDTMAEVKAGIDVSIEKARKSIAELAPAAVRVGEVEGKAGIHSRRLLEQLAEIGQELLQPLTVINCSLQMLIDGFLGTIKKEQMDVLELSSASGLRMKELMDRLISVVGFPQDPKIPGTTSSDSLPTQK